MKKKTTLLFLTSFSYEEVMANLARCLRFDRCRRGLNAGNTGKTMRNQSDTTKKFREMPNLVKSRVPKNVTFLCSHSEEVQSMKEKREGGFSIIELLLVCVVAGIIATIAIPYLQKAVHATENRGMQATLKSVASTQLSFATTNSRYGRLNEVNNLMSGAIGTTSGTDVTRGQFTVSMVPPTPTDAELRNGYVINASRTIPGEGLYVYELTETGRVRQVLPACTVDCE